MKYMMDTNTCIFLMKKHPNVTAEFMAKRSQGIVTAEFALS